MKDKKVLFIRHNFDVRKNPEWVQIAETLYNNKQIGVHFWDYGFDVNKYANDKAAKTSINYIIESSNSGAETIIVACYHGKDKILIGTPQKDSKDTTVIAGLEIKHVQLENIKIISVNDFPLPFLIPPPYSTFVEWRKAKIAVNAFYNDKIPEISNDWLGYLSPGQLEILCEEWMRNTNKISYRLFKTGKSMKNHDIVGVDDKNDLVFAQVKYTCSDTDITSYFDSDNSKNANKYFFTSGSDIISNQVIDLNTVLDYFIKNRYEYLIRLTFGINPT